MDGDIASWTMVISRNHIREYIVSGGLPELGEFAIKRLGCMK
jgi:hypothetical protein